MTWHKEPETVLEAGVGNKFDKWFPDGEMSMAFNCIDKHVDEDKGDNMCLLFSSA